MQYSSSTPSFNNNKNNGGSRNFTHSPENVRSQSYRSTVFYRDEDGTTHQTLSYLNPNPNKEQFFESLKETYAKEPQKLIRSGDPLGPLKVSFRETQRQWEKDLLGVKTSKEFDPSNQESASRIALKNALKKQHETDEERYERQRKRRMKLREQILSGQAIVTDAWDRVPTEPTETKEVLTMKRDSAIEYKNNGKTIPKKIAEKYIKAVQHRLWVKVVYMLRKNQDIPVDMRVKFGSTALMVAASARNTAAVTMLLEMGADPTLTNDYARNALMNAAGAGSKHIVDYILQNDIEHRLNLFATDNKGKTALDWARSGGFHDVAASLEKAILKVIEKKRNKRYNQKHFEYLRNLVNLNKKLADEIAPAIMRNDMDTVLEKCVIASNNHLDPQTYASAVEQLNMPDWNHDYFLDTETKEGWTPLLRAVSNNDGLFVEKFLMNGANVDKEVRKLGHTALTWACTSGYAALVKLLIANRANINLGVGRWGETPLIKASCENKKTIVSILLDSILAWSFSERERVKREANESRTEEERQDKLKKGWIQFYNEAVSIQDANRRSAMDYAKRLGLGDVISLFNNSQDRVERKLALEAKERALAKPTPCSLGCGYVGRADRIKYHEERHCVERLVYCEKKCGEKIKFKNVQDHEENHCELRIMVCTNAYFGCMEKMVAKKVKYHAEKFCKKRTVYCRLECGEKLPWDVRPFHEENECLLRVVSCELSCGRHDLRVKDMMHHLKTECPKRLVPCRYRCGTICRFEELEDHMAHTCLQECRWGCGLKLAPEDRRKIHEMWICPLRIVQCHLGCNTMGIRAQDLEEHETQICQERLVPCSYGCGKMLKAKLLHEHLHGLGGDKAEHAECPQRPLHCQLDYIDKRLRIYKTSPHWNLASVDDADKYFTEQDAYSFVARITHFREEDENHRFINMHSERFWAKLSDLRFDIIDDGPWRCGQMLDAERKEHRESACPRRMLKCRNGCGQLLEAKFLLAHENEQCKMNKVVCTQGCGKTLAQKDLQHHEEKECKFRKVFCECLKYIPFCDFQDHVKNQCDVRLKSCRRGCGVLVPVIHMQNHLDNQCDKRIVKCPLGCPIRKMWAQESRNHTENDCPLRLLDCKVSCGEKFKACELEDHEKNHCVERLVPCTIGCGDQLKLSQMHDHVTYHCNDRVVKCPQGCPVRIKWSAMLHHELHECVNRYTTCELGCGLSVLVRNKEKHETQECVRRGIDCPLGCGDTIVAETLKYHKKSCPCRRIPCGQRAKNCTRQIRMWLTGDTANANGKLQYCEEHKSTALIWAAGRGELDLMDYLIGCTDGSDIDHESSVGLNAMITACNAGQFRAVKLLLQRGANIDGETSRGYTPLIESIKEGRKEIALYLAAQGAIIAYKNRFRRSALDWARLKFGEESDEYKKLNEIDVMQKRHRILLNHILMDRFEEMYDMIRDGIEHEMNAIPLMREKVEKARIIRGESIREIEKISAELELKKPELTTKKKVIDDAEAEIVVMKAEADKIHVKVEGMRNTIESAVNNILFDVQRLKSNEIRSACDIKYPTPQFDLIMRAAMLMLDIPPKRKRDPRTNEMIDDYWTAGCKMMKSNNYFRAFWNKVNIKILLEPEKLEKLQTEFTDNPLIEYDWEGESSDEEEERDDVDDDNLETEPRYGFMRLLSRWVRTVEKLNRVNEEFKPMIEEETKLRVGYETIDNGLWQAREAYRRIFSDCSVIENVLDDHREKLEEAESVIFKTLKHLRVAELLSYRSEGGHNALTWACANGKTDMVAVLIDHGASLVFEDDHYQLAAKIIQYKWRYVLYKRNRGEWNKLVSLTFKMAEIAHMFAMKSLVAQIRKVRLQVRGPLTEAAYNGHLETVKLLIERGATLSRKTGLHPTAPPPHRYPSFTVDGATAGLDKIPQYGPIVHRLEEGMDSAACAKLGKEHFGHDHWQDGRGWIIRNRWTYTVEYLDKAQRLSDDAIAKWIEHRNSWLKAKEEIEHLKQLDIKCGIAVNNCNFNEVDHLLKLGASSDFVNEFGHTPLTMAAACEITSVNDDGTVTPAVELLLDREERRPNIDYETPQGYTALSWAAKNGRVRTIEVLLDRGSEINRIARDGKTALLHAAMNGQNESVRLLIERGADPFQKDHGGKNAIDWALANNFSGVARNIYNAQAGNLGMARANKGKAIVLYTCGLGCGKKLPKIDIPLHEETECPKRIIPCTNGCGIDDLWAQDEEYHKKHECKKRLLPCILKCKLMIPEDEMVKHVRKHCRRREIKCKLHCGKKMEFQELERHVDVDCKHRLVFCKQGCGIKLKYKDQNKHCQLECIKRIVRCKQGCGKEMMFEELKEHHLDRCLCREVPCRLHCGKKMQFQDRPTHEAHYCIKRTVPCKNRCGEEFPAQEMSRHLKNDCIYRPVPCPLKCGFQIAFANVIKHVEHECEARMYKCSQGCGKEMVHKEKEQHELHDCPHRWVNCGNGCGERLKLSEMKEHKEKTCGKRTIICTHCPKEMYADELAFHLQNKCKKAQMYCRFGCGEMVLRGKMRTHEKRHCPMRNTVCSLGCGVELREKDRLYHETEICIRKHSGKKTGTRGGTGKSRGGSKQRKSRFPTLESRGSDASSSSYGSYGRSSAPTTPAQQGAGGKRNINTPMSMPALSRENTPIGLHGKSRLSKTAGNG